MKNTPLKNKEISWLSFNARVLQEAADPDVPLYERIKFLGIYSSNMDEFFRVRVATLRRLAMMGKEAREGMKQDPDEILKQIQDIVIEQHDSFDSVYKDILISLGRQSVYIIDETQLNSEQGVFVRTFFRSQVRAKLFPIMLDQVSEFPSMRDEGIYLAVNLTHARGKQKPKQALIEIPSEILPRFITLPSKGRKKFLIFLDDIIRYNLDDIFSFFPYNRFEAYTVKLTRDSELDIADDMSQSFIKKVSKSLKQRKEGDPVRLVHDACIPPDLLNVFKKGLEITDKDACIAGARYHNFKDFINFPDFWLHDHKYQKTTPLPHHAIHSKKSLMEVITRRDILLHYPYQSFDYVIDLLREASIDPRVTSIKFTLYRVAKYSTVINALINAARNGKTVVVVLELQARFDEEANIYWANRLQEEGVKVIYGVPGLKVHSKLCLITRKKSDGPSRFAIIGTGNYNENTARIYSDHSLFTADSRLTREVTRVFDFFENNYNVSSFKHLLVAPFNLRKKIVQLIKNEIQYAELGREASIFMKVNNLVDSKIIRQLYAASSANVKIRLIVRSMCALIPGIESVSENIKAISIVDKYLEHSRIFIFHNGGDVRYFIGSADIMPRNLDRRVEVISPVFDTRIQQELRRFMEIQWMDNCKARIWTESMENRIRTNGGIKKVRAQWDIYDFLQKTHRFREG